MIDDFVSLIPKEKEEKDHFNWLEFVGRVSMYPIFDVMSL